METPICFSYFFVNKQNVRSFSNIFNVKLLKVGNSEQFLYHIFQDEYPVSQINPDLRNLLNEIRINILKNCRQDFKEVFRLQNCCKLIEAVDKKEVLKGCLTWLLKMIPKSLFGNNHNLKLFQKCIKTLVFSMRKQHFILSNLILTWNFKVSPWNFYEETKSRSILQIILTWVFRNILSAIICLNFYVTTCKIDADENKLHYFWKAQWQSFYDKEISKMIQRNVIAKYESYCLGKKAKKKYKPQRRISIKLIRKEIPKLHLILKPKNEVRPIVRYKNGTLNSSEKFKIKERLAFLKSLDAQRGEKLESQFSVLHSKWLRRDKPKLYFVKTDLSNAFGSIKKSLLLKIISEKMMHYQNSERPLHIKRKFTAHYKELMGELQKPFLVRIGSTIYMWKTGLIQGYVYSPALSELYYNYLDKLYFSDHLKKTEEQIKLFVRVVDDYLYITDSLEDAHSFLKSLSKYKNVNYNKTAANFEYSGIKFCEDITFLGYTYNTKNLVVNRASNINTGQMCYKITFSPSIVNINTFLESRIGQTGIVINSLLFNFSNSDEGIIWRHIFVTFCISANKFCTIISILCEERDMLSYLSLYKKQVTVKLCNSIIEVLLRNKPKDFMFIYCINHFRYLSWRALSLCAKRTPKCNNLSRHIDIELSKSNCIFGKWREHASRIGKNGHCEKPALKIVCRRSDLRKMMNSLEDLPAGFQCYKNMFE